MDNFDSGWIIVYDNKQTKPPKHKKKQQIIHGIS